MSKKIIPFCKIVKKKRLFMVPCKSAAGELSFQEKLHHSIWSTDLKVKLHCMSLHLTLGVKII